MVKDILAVLDDLEAESELYGLLFVRIASLGFGIA